VGTASQAIAVLEYGWAVPTTVDLVSKRFIHCPPYAQCDRKPVHRLNLTTRRILCHTPVSSDAPKQFYDWDPEAEVQAGDTLVYIDVAHHNQLWSRTFVITVIRPTLLKFNTP
jgi:hypothetical protein